jgi:hypothetical protein
MSYLLIASTKGIITIFPIISIAIERSIPILLILKYLVFLKKDILFNTLRSKLYTTITLLKGKDFITSLDKFNILLDFRE